MHDIAFVQQVEQAERQQYNWSKQDEITDLIAISKALSNAAALPSTIDLNRESQEQLQNRLASIHQQIADIVTDPNNVGLQTLVLREDPTPDEIVGVPKACKDPKSKQFIDKCCHAPEFKPVISNRKNKKYLKGFSQSTQTAVQECATVDPNLVLHV